MTTLTWQRRLVCARDCRLLLCARDCRLLFGERLCPHCGDKIPSNYYEHLFSSHLPESKYSTETTIQWLENKNFHDFINLAEKISCLKFTD